MSAVRPANKSFYRLQSTNAMLCVKYKRIIENLGISV